MKNFFCQEKKLKNLHVILCHLPKNVYQHVLHIPTEHTECYSAEWLRCEARETQKNRGRL
jgi:hypothetical protein